MVPYQVPGNVNLTGAGVVGPSGKPIRVFHVSLVSSGTPSTCTLCNGTTNATPYLQIDGTASKQVDLDFHYGVRFPQGCYFNDDSNETYVTIVFTEEQ
jgi:hypothetical protein